MPPTFTKQSLILAIDVGSSSVRAAICNSLGQLVNNLFVQEHYLPETTGDGGSFIEPESLIALVYKCIDAALQKLGSKPVEAVVIDTLVSNLVGVNSEGEAITPIYTWADKRGSHLTAEWHKRLATQGLTPADYIDRTGCQIHTSYWPVRLLWLAQTDPDTYSRVAYWMSIGDYLYFRLFGKRMISISAASWSGLLNRRTLQWDENIQQALNLSPDQLSTPGSEPFQAEGKSRWSQLREAWWFPAVGDGAASNIGAGCTSSSHVALAVGTSAAVRIIVPGAPETVPDGLFAYRLDSNRSIVGGALSNAGNLYQWMSQVMRLPESYQFETSIADIAPDSHGLTILPFLAGERAPGWHPDAKAVFMGMTLDTKPEQLLRAGLEAVAYRIAQVANRLKLHLRDNAVYVASGAAILNSPIWMQIMADVLYAPVYAATEQEATLRGTVHLATGYQPEPQLGKLYTPDESRHRIYQAAMERQQALYHRLLN